VRGNWTPTGAERSWSRNLDPIDEWMDGWKNRLLLNNEKTDKITFKNVVNKYKKLLKRHEKIE